MKIEEVIPEYGHADFYTKTERDKKHREQIISYRRQKQKWDQDRRERELT